MPKLKPIQVDAMQDLYEKEEWSLGRIAAGFGVTPGAVGYQLRKRNVKMRPTGSRPLSANERREREGAKTSSPPSDAERRRSARELRNQAMRQRRREGARLSEIAAEFSVGVPHASRIVASVVLDKSTVWLNSDATMPSLPQDAHASP